MTDRRQCEPAERTQAAVPRAQVSTSYGGLAARSAPHAVSQLAARIDGRTSGARATAPARPNRTGLPDGLKNGIEALSGIAFDDVRVHRNSPHPAKLQAHAFARGSEIHLAPGKEGHLPHEAWHIVQQKQGRVARTGLSGNTAINDDIALENEADAMGDRAARLPPVPAQTVSLATRDAAPGVAQCITVDANDIGQTFDVTTSNGIRQNGVLQRIPGNGRYMFDCGTVVGQANIHARVGGSATGITGLGGAHVPSVPTAPVLTPTAPSLPISMPASGTALPTTQTEFNIGQIATTRGVNPLGAIDLIRESFQSKPRTIRVHFPFGSKTVTKGNPAFDTPDETTKRPQGMVSYRKGDFGKKHRKVKKDYSDFVAELSDNEAEPVKQKRARKVIDYLETGSATNFDDLTSEGRAALGGLMSVGLISDPMRTEHHSQRTQEDFMAELHKRERGETSLHKSFGSKKGSTFLPARSSGSKEQRKKLRSQPVTTKTVPTTTVPTSIAPTTNALGPGLASVPVQKPSQDMVDLQANVVGVADDLLRLLQQQNDLGDGTRAFYAAAVQALRNQAGGTNLLAIGSQQNLLQIGAQLNQTYRLSAAVLTRDLIHHTNPEDPLGATGERLMALEQAFAECGQMAAHNALAIVGHADLTAQNIQTAIANRTNLDTLGNFANNIDENAIRQMLAARGTTDVPVMGNIGQVGAIVDHLNQNDIAWFNARQIGLGERNSLEPVRSFMLGAIDSLTLILNTQGHQNVATQQLHWITIRVTRTPNGGLAIQYLDSLRALANYAGLFTALRQLLARAPAQPLPQVQVQAPQLGGSGGPPGPSTGSNGSNPFSFGSSFSLSSPFAPSTLSLPPSQGNGTSHGTGGFPSSALFSPYSGSPLPPLFPDFDDDLMDF